MNLAKMWAPQRYGDKLQLEVTQRPSLTAALDRKFRAIVLPGGDLEQVQHVQDAEFTAIPDMRTTDKVSVEPTPSYADVFDD
jgi:hypothetical protein